jgi:hypothetical protein
MGLIYKIYPTKSHFCTLDGSFFHGCRCDELNSLVGFGMISVARPAQEATLGRY